MGHFVLAPVIWFGFGGFQLGMPLPSLGFDCSTSCCCAWVELVCPLSFGFWGLWVFFCSGLVCCVLPLAGFHLAQVDFGFGQLSKLGQKIEVAFSAFPLA